MSDEGTSPAGSPWLTAGNSHPATHHSSLITHHSPDRLAEQFGALVAALGRLVAEGQADVLGAAPPGEAGGARHVEDARLAGELPDPRRVRARRQLQPEEEA